MRNFICSGTIAACLAACSSGATQSEGQTKISAVAGDVVLCSSSRGPLAGPLSTIADAGDVQGCQPGGQCIYVTSPPPGGGQGGNCTETLDDSGNGGVVNCPQTSFVPSWQCVYSTGSAGPSGH